MLCSCTEASLGVEVACRQSWGKQLLLLGLWTGTKKQEGFALGMQKKLYWEPWLVVGWSDPKNLETGRSVLVEDCDKAELLLGNPLLIRSC